MRRPPALFLIFPLATLFSVGCRGQVRFDEHALDASVDISTSCTDAGCGFETEECSRESCDLECHSRRLCSGSCGDDCSVECEPASDCTIGTGNESNVRCEKGARCSVALGPSSTVSCGEDTRCDVRCLANCTVKCAPTAICTLACAKESWPHPAGGMTGCP